jgi:protein-tyrosine phosphatase
MAAALFREMVVREGSDLEWRIESAGTWAAEGSQAVSQVQQILDERGIVLGDHLSQSVSEKLMRRFDLILTMERSHKEALRIEFPSFSERILLLSEIAGFEHDIEDPIGGSISEYRITANEIEELLKRGYDRIVSLASK